MPMTPASTTPVFARSATGPSQDEVARFVQMYLDRYLTDPTVGPPGPPGPSGSSSSAIAAETLSGHRIVSPSPGGGVRYATPGDSFTRGPFYLTTAAAAEGALVPIVSFGPVEESSWSWNPLEVLYLDGVGELSRTPPSSGFVLQFAVAYEPQKIFIIDHLPIIIS